MKRGKSFIRVLLTVVMLLCSMCFVACRQGNAGGNGNGTYYLYENEQLDKSSFIKLGGGKWSDDDKENGTYSISGDTVTIYIEIEGQKEEFAKGTLKDGVLTLTIMGKTVVYCQEGKTPSSPSKPDNSSEPDNPSEPNNPSEPDNPSESDKSSEPDKTDKFTVSFNANGGTFADNTSILEIKDIEKGGFVENPVSPTRNGYVFVGWSIEKERDDLWDFEKNEIDSDTVLYAVWKIDYKHSIVSAEGFEMSDKTLTTYIISLDGTYDLRDKFKVSDGASWRAFSSADCSQPTELTNLVADVEYGWNDVYVMVENQTKSTVYDFKIYRAPVSSVTLLDDDTYKIDKGVDFSEVVIPSKYNGKKITSIGFYAFSGCSKLTNITISDSVTSIGFYAFSGCSKLTNITIPDSVTSIGDSAFNGCSGLENIYITDIAAWCNISGLDNLMVWGSSNKKLYLNNELVTKLVIPNSVTSIGSSAFSGCSKLTNITIPDSVTSIGSSAFSGCSGLTSVTILDSVTSINNYAFYDCRGLKAIHFNGTVAQWEKILKGYDWHYNVPSSCKVICPDGEISL